MNIFKKMNNCIKSEKGSKVRSIIAIPLYFITLVGLDFAFRYMYGYVGSIGVFDFTPCIFTLCWAALFGAISLILPKILARIFIISTGVFFAIFVLLNAAFNHIFGRFFTITDLLFAEDGAAFFDFSYLKFRRGVWVIAILCIVLSIVAALNLKQCRYRPWRFIVSFSLIAISIIIIVLTNNKHQYVENEVKISWEMSADVDVLTEKSDEEILAEEYYYFTNQNKMLPFCGIYQYAFKDIETTIRDLYFDKETLSLDEISDYHDKNSEIKNQDNYMTGALKGKNLIMIMVESLDDWELNESFTPNLYALSKKSILFENNYTPLWTAGGTFSTEFVSQTGLITPASTGSNTVYYENSFPYSLANLFKNEGYSANSFHAASPDIYKRGMIHTNMGFSNYFYSSTLSMENYLYDTQLLNGYDKIVSDTPFFSFIITISGHGPYEKDGNFTPVSEKYLDRALQAISNENITGTEEQIEELSIALAQMMETDDFIGELISKLESDGHINDTAIVVYGDHYCKYYSDSEYLQKLKGVDNKNMLCHTPFFIYSADIEPQTISKIIASYDIFPTIVNLFDLKCDLGYFVGDDAFSDNGGYVFWRDNSYFDGTYHEYDGTPTAKESKRRLIISGNTIRYNYFSDK